MSIRSRLAWRAFLPFWFALVMSIAVIALQISQSKTIYLQNARADAAAEASVIRSKLEGIVQADMQLVRGLIALVSADPDITQEEFSGVASWAIGDREQFLNLGVAPGFVLSMVHPENERTKRVLGLNLLEDPVRKPVVEYMRETGEIVFAGPIDLIVGETGFIGRFPIFSSDGGVSAVNGIMSVVISADSIYEKSGLTDPGSGLVMALRGKNGTGAEGALFFGDESTFQNDPVLLDIVLPNGSWQLAAVPRAGWGQPLGEIAERYFLLISAALTFVLSTFAVCRIAAQRAKIIDELTLREKELQASKEQLQVAKNKADNASRAKSEFLANMSHEIRTAMNGIMGMSEILEDSDLPEDARENITLIRESATGLLQVINDVLDLSSLEAGKLTISPRDFRLRACVDSALKLIKPAAENKGIKLTLDYDPDLPVRVHADDGRLRQILMNLLGNAVKFTEQGEIAVRLRQSSEDAEKIEFCVSDTGIGMTEQQLHRVFERFAQADTSISRTYGGTGLGLAISQHMVTLMGGKISVLSQTGQGSVFTFTIKVQPAKAPPPKADQPADTFISQMAGKKVLIADDSRTNRIIASKHLAEMGLEVLEALDGEEAISVTMEQTPAIILMDMSMPKVDGLCATRRIRKLEIEQPRIIALTANAFARDRAACIEAGMDSFLSKPIQKRDLQAAVADQLNKAEFETKVPEAT